MIPSLILEEIRDVCEGDSNSQNLDNTTLLRRINTAYEEVVDLIRNCDGLWQFDDTNFSDFPIATTTLVANQQDYTFATDVLEVEQVSVKNANGLWEVLYPIDRSQMGEDPAEFYKTAGMPIYYDKLGNSLVLYPAPSASYVTLASGLKVSFSRTASIYTAAQFTTDTKEPGFASQFHMIIPYKASLMYLATHIPRKVPFVMSEIRRLEEGLKQHYGRRERDRKKVISPSGISYV